MQNERINNGFSGYAAFVVMLVLQFAFPITAAVGVVVYESPGVVIPSVLGTILIAVLWRFCFFTVRPNEAKVLQIFGAYAGTAVRPGLRFANPFYTKRAISKRIRNFESGKLKVNESGGSPIEIAAIVVWQVVDTAEAAFEVDDFEAFVTIQSEAALRNLATSYPYETDDDDDRLSLRGDPIRVSEALDREIQERVEKAGVRVLEARISHLAYSPEIAAAMLRRQQASAIIAARKQIVSGAVDIVQMALEGLQREGVVELDEERRASMVGNLLVVLCGEQQAQPIVNTGTLYS
jgi:regulator of protease activity HflC (stomatin/prohibitin superfamily)